MKFSELLIPTLREPPSEAEIISHQLMIRAGMIRKVASGIYTYLPLALKVIRNIERIIREEMNVAGAQELLLPIVMPKELWEETKRWEVYGKELWRIKDRHERDFCLGPTHEEAITDLVRNEIKSYRQLPLSLFQIQTKFRDEIRPRFGLMRGREFIMKDCYSFDRNEEESIKTYWRMFEAYQKIFTRCGISFRPVEAGTGAIGGTLSHEFHVLAQSGEDEIFYCESCEYAASTEKVTEDKKCSKCQTAVKSARGIEVGQVFFLGTKYSKAMKAVYLDTEGKEQTIVMGCYGIGVSRTAAASIEQNHDEKGIIWPLAIAPFQVEVIPLGQGDDEVTKVAHAIYEELKKKKIDVLIDDREGSAGVKFNDADLLGIPFRIQIGKKGLANGDVEIKERKTGKIGLVKKEKVVEELLRQIS